MDKESIKKIEKFSQGVFTAFFCILLYHWIVGNSNPWSNAFWQTTQQTIDGIKSPIISRIEYRVKDILNRDTIECDELSELYSEVNFISNINCKSENGTSLLIGVVKARDQYDLSNFKHNLDCPGNRDIFIKKLISKEVNLNARDNLGRTALMWNTIKGSRLTYAVTAYKIEVLLIENEAALHYKDHFGKTALDYAKENNSPLFISLLESAIANKPIDILSLLKYQKHQR
jgi:hypothetical protein